MNCPLLAFSLLLQFVSSPAPPLYVFLDSAFVDYAIMSGLVVVLMQKVLDLLSRCAVFFENGRCKKGQTLSFDLIDRILLGR